jgi:hypothetical protein
MYLSDGRSTCLLAVAEDGEGLDIHLARARRDLRRKGLPSVPEARGIWSWETVTAPEGAGHEVR